METYKKIKEIKKRIQFEKNKRRTIGFVPTMGYLHDGHISLIRASKKRSDVTVVSIFVNPTQFGPSEDFSQYPRDINRDKTILEREKVDLLFSPSVEEMYFEDYKTYVEVTEYQDKLCGKSRKGHFRGVATIVLKLFHIITPDIAFFGQKDAQQALVIKKMVKDLNLDIKIEVLPIVREKDGLALSSRNTYLNEEERVSAVVLYNSLLKAKELIKKGVRNCSEVISEMEKIILSSPHTRIDYIEIVNDKLEPLEEINHNFLIALAVYIGKTRLIDNMMVKKKGRFFKFII
ncbi:MAG: pantoate--beta-alanine ligase [Acidobacteriota bacterium]